MQQSIRKKGFETKGEEEQPYFQVHCTLYTVRVPAPQTCGVLVRVVKVLTRKMSKSH